MARRTSLPRGWGADPFTVADALSAGISPDRLRGRDLERPFHGVRVDPTRVSEASNLGVLPSPREAEEYARLVARCRAYAPLLRPGQFFSHATAAQLWKAAMPHTFTAEDPLNVSVRAPGRAPRSLGIIGHQAPANARIRDRFGLPVADPVATWLSLGASVGTAMEVDDLVAVADHLVLDPVRLDPYDPRPYATIAELQAGLREFSGRGARAAASAIGHVRERVESRQETRLRLVLVRAGLPEPELGVDIYDDSGVWLGRADQLFREWKVISEYDGQQHRTSSAQYDRDQIRLEDFRRAGHATVQTRHQQLYPRPEVAVERVLKALRSHGYPD